MQLADHYQALGKKSFCHVENRGISGGWAGWAIAHPGFGRIEGAALLIAHPANYAPDLYDKKKKHRHRVIVKK